MFPKSLTEKKKTPKTPGFSLIPASVEKIDCVHMQWKEAAKKLFTFAAQLILAEFAPPHHPRGCDPGIKSNAGTELRQLNAGPQQRGALHYSNSS